MTEQDQIPIGLVERDTGIGKDTLRVWQRRYGFPNPRRDASGERLFTQQEVERLRRIRTLMDHGLRPSKVVGLDEAAFDSLWREHQKGVQAEPIPAEIERLLDLLLAHDTDRLQAELDRQLAVLGVQQLVLQRIRPLVQEVGLRWARGELAVYEEHLLTRELYRFLDATNMRLGRASNGPLTLLATLPGELHGLGLLMVETLLNGSGQRVASIGVDVPLDQIVLAASQTGAARVALSFSASYKAKPAKQHLASLREQLPDEVELLAGGAGIERIRRLPVGVQRIPALESLLD